MRNLELIIDKASLHSFRQQMDRKGPLLRSPAFQTLTEAKPPPACSLSNLSDQTKREFKGTT